MDPLKRAREDASQDYWDSAQAHALIAIAAELHAIREALSPQTVDRT